MRIVHVLSVAILAQGSRIRKVILELPVMAAGGAAGSASRELPAPRRPVLAPLLFNEKEYFYRARVLRRARKAVVSAGRPDRPAEGGDQQAVRLDNMRELLETYGGCAAGDEVPIDDGVLVLLGFDPVEAYWACKKANMYIWVPERNFT